MAQNAGVSLSIEVSGSLRTTNGTVVTVDRSTVVLQETGPRGGVTSRVRVNLADWDAVDAAVRQVKDAIDASKRVVEEAKAAGWRAS